MFKLNVDRVFKAPVSVCLVDEAGNAVDGDFQATFRVLPHDEAKKDGDKPLLDLVLVELHDIELTGKDGQALHGDDAVAAARNDPALSSALVRSYWEHVAKKPSGKT